MMEIERVETYPLLYRLPKAYGDANGYKRYRTTYLIRILTTSGVDGWGEILDWLPTLDLGFRERIIPYLIGKQATDRLSITAVLKKWHQRSAAGVGMALTEIVAKASGLSVCDLWGGRIHPAIPVYASFQSYREEPEWMSTSIAQVMEQVGAGFKKIKVKIGGRSLREDQKHIEALMNSLGPDVCVALDGNQSYDLAAARDWEHLISRYPNWMWLEEPMPLDQVQEYVKLRACLPIPLAGGENLVRPPQFLPFLQNGALDIYQPDPMHAEGLESYRALVELARQFSHRVSPHCYDGSLSRLYAIYAQACLPAWSKMNSQQIEPVEWDVMENPFTELFPVKPVQGEVKLPEGPGIGVEPDWERIHALRWDGEVYV
ncbi:isomerase [Brevibacillus panacihumi W25]|uniref:Isomerase n=2 Tax=Brevibacillus panacihumi TaxID=497735 RepID=V6M2C6_9BACL|nr:isomerase [Brevibacillus panacihumi W25]